MIKKFSAFASVFAFVGMVGVAQVFATDPRVEQGARFEAKGEFEKALGEYRSILADDPKNSEAYYLAAQTRMKMKDYSGALANFRLAYRFTPTMSEAYEGAAKVYEALGQKAKAEAERAKDPKNNPVVEEVAESAPAAEAPAAEESKAAPVQEVAEVKEEPKPEPAKVAAPVETEAAPAASAAPEASAVAEEDDGLPKDPFERGKALFDAGKYEDAVPLWRAVLAKRPGDAGAYFYAGLTRFELGEYDKAEYNLKKGLTYKVRGNDANYFLSQVYAKDGRTELEKKYLQAYLKKASPSSAFRSVAENRLAELKGESEKQTVAEEAPVAAAESLEVKPAPEVKAPAKEEVAVPAKDVKPAKVVNPDGPSIEAANILLKGRNYEQALQMYKELLDTDLEPEKRYFAMLQMGNIYRELRDYHSAVNRYRVIVQEFPDSDWATEAERAQLEAIWQEKHAADFPRKKR